MILKLISNKLNEISSLNKLIFNNNKINNIFLFLIELVNMNKNEINKNTDTIEPKIHLQIINIANCHIIINKNDSFSKILAI